MLIENQIVKIKWHPSNKKYYENLGYFYTKIGNEFDVKIEDLTKGSKAYVDIKCDYCGKIFKRKYLNYNHQYSPELGDACDECKKIKTQKSNIKKYGVNNVFILNETKEKIKNSCIKKYGVNHYSKCEEYKEKIKQTSLEKYGVSSYTKTKEYKEKTIKTNLEKYGVEYHTKLEESKNKSKETSLKKYGVEFYTQTEDYKQRYKETCLKKYGTEYSTQNYKIKEKIRKSFYNNGTCPTSKPQIKLYNLLKENYELCELNYPCGICSLDIMIKIKDIKIDIEYDGWYWHKNRIKEDRKRDYFINSKGYKILRIKGNVEVPTKEQLIEAIDYLVKSNHSYNEIILDI